MMMDYSRLGGDADDRNLPDCDPAVEKLALPFQNCLYPLNVELFTSSQFG
jgi:hypothetical protein